MMDYYILDQHFGTTGMYACWNCEHLIRMYSGKLVNEILFDKEARKCKVKGIIFERFSEIKEERECDDFKESKCWPKISRYTRSFSR